MPRQLPVGVPLNIPKFVKPTRIRDVSNLSFNNSFGDTINDSDHGGSTSSYSITYAPQSDLPPLPVPTLDETMEKFLKNVEAIEADLDPEERFATEQVVREFLRDTRSTNGEKGDLEKNDDASVTGRVLQELLLEYDKNGRKSGSICSYVEEFWSDAYLAPEASVVLNLNPYFLLEESPDPKMAGNQINRAASLCFASVKMASQLRKETLKPDTFRGKALCMSQFRSLFGAARIPSRRRDSIASYDRSNHVVVMCRNQMFHFQALWHDTGDVAVSEGDLRNILEAIKNHTSEFESKSGSNEMECRNSLSALGVLTSLARHQWAKAREEMIDFSPKNAESFAVIDSALFVLVLDDYIPKNKHDAAANMLHGSYELAELKSSDSKSSNEYQSGSCTNRWYDKLQIIVTADGGAGINFEHSAIDGHTALRFVSDIYADTVMSFAQTITKLVHAHEGLIPSVITAKVKRPSLTVNKSFDVSPKKIGFVLSDQIKRKIYFAETALGDQILASDTYILEFKDFGKHFITHNRLSPDSFVQMSMMLAYYRLYGKIVCAYEPVLTKSFFHGRTEAMRPATMEAKHFCEVFSDPTSKAREKIGALRKATINHSRLVKECAQGKGVDRHLFALKCIAEKNGLPIPDFFRSECYRKLNHTILSTSNCGNPSLALFGFGPVVSDGYGIGYIIKDYVLHFAICSKHRQTTRYALTLEGVLREIANLLEPISFTKVNDSNDLSPTKHDNTITVKNESYADLWGESSFQSVVDEGRPGVIQETTAEERWNRGFLLNAGDVEVPEHSDFLSSPIKAPLNDDPAPADIITALPPDRGKIRRERRGSNDLMPVRPDRRSSVNIFAIEKGDLTDLKKLDDEPEADANPPAKLDDFLEENTKEDFNDSARISETVFQAGQIVAPVTDAASTDNIVPASAMTPIPENRKASGQNSRRGSHDFVPVKPDRRISVNAIMVGKEDLSELLKLEDKTEVKPQMNGKD
jgi:carnitine O-acetyltransferase